MEVEEKDENIQIISLDSLLEILGNPTRRAILNKLAKFPHSAPELANALGISRQAVHSQLTLLQEKNIIEPLEASEIRGDKYRIKTNISVNIDITPDYYNIKYNTSTTDPESELFDFKDMNCSVDYSKIKAPNDKIRFLSEEIRKIEKTMTDLELKRKEILNQKECLILEIKNLMHGQFKDNLEKLLKEKYEGNIKDKNLRASLNLTEEILTTMFFNPERYFNRFNIDRLMEDIFLSDMDRYERDRRFISIRPVLEEISRLMGFFREDDDWFFDF